MSDSNYTRRQMLRTVSASIAGTGLMSLLGRTALADDRSSRPNILFFFPDQHRFDWLGTNAAVPVQTPNLDQLGKEGMRFTQTFCASPVCAPSRACLAAGKEYDRCGVANNSENFPLHQRTFFSLLRDGGYHVVACGKLDLEKGRHHWGVDGKFHLPELGFSDGINNAGKMDAINHGTKEIEPYMAFLAARGLDKVHLSDFAGRGKDPYGVTTPTPLPDDAYCDNWVAANGLSLMKNFPKGKPWMLWVNFPGPHDPIDITRKMEESCRKLEKIPQPNGNNQYSAGKHVEIRQNYSAMVHNIDRWMGVYIEELKRRGELENTLIVYSSDHGEMLGDHNRWAKCVPYQPSVGVPLIVAGPGVKKNVVSPALVSVMDLAATFLDYGGVKTPSDMDSRSIRDVLEGRTEKHREHLLSGLNNWRLVYDGRYKLVRGFSGKDHIQLFDLSADPLENTDLADTHKDEVARLLAKLPA